MQQQAGLGRRELEVGLVCAGLDGPDVLSVFARRCQRGRVLLQLRCHLLSAPRASATGGATVAAAALNAARLTAAYASTCLPAAIDPAITAAVAATAVHGW